LTSVLIKEEDRYENLITNKLLIGLFKSYLERSGFDDLERPFTSPAGSTDMGNVSHKVPSINALYAIPAEGINHTKPFTEASGFETAQEPTLKVSKAMAMTALYLMRSPEKVEEAKILFEQDLQEDLRKD